MNGVGGSGGDSRGVLSQKSVATGNLGNHSLSALSRWPLSLVTAARAPAGQAPPVAAAAAYCAGLGVSSEGETLPSPTAVGIHAGTYLKPPLGTSVGTLMR